MSHTEFIDLLGRLGVVPGATVLVHSSMAEIARRVPGMNAPRLIATVLELIGPDGTLAMPTYPFSGLQADYVKNHRSYNPKTTPSQVGLLPEIFRRMPDVHRSLHPTHPVAAVGKHARDILDTHHLGTAFGETSPFCKMADYAGIVIGIGVPPETATILHVPEYLHPTSRKQQYATDCVSMEIVTGDTTIAYELCPLRGDTTRYYGRAIRALRQSGVLTIITMKGLRCCCAPVKELIAHSLKLIDGNQYYGT